MLTLEQNKLYWPILISKTNPEWIYAAINCKWLNNKMMLFRSDIISYKKEPLPYINKTALVFKTYEYAFIKTYEYLKMSNLINSFSVEILDYNVEENPNHSHEIVDEI